MTSAKEIKSRKFILDHFEIQDGKSGGRGARNNNT